MRHSNGLQKKVINKKMLGLVVIMVMLGIVFFCSQTLQPKSFRYHQHQEAKVLAPCGHQAGEFCTHLPLVSLDTHGQAVPGMKRDGTTIVVDMAIREGKNSRNHLADLPKIFSQARIRYRGNSSLYFDKKSYWLKLIKEDGADNKQSILGMPKEEEWILNGPFLDKSLIRNYMCMNISAEIMGNAPQVRFCELFVNDAYQGVYVMMENVSRGRVGIQKTMEDRDETSYIVQLDKWRAQRIYVNPLSRYAMLTTAVMNVEYPPKTRLTQGNIDYIEKDLSRFEKALYSLDYQDPALGYEQYIDVDSFVEYLLINEFFQNYDAGTLSTYLHKDVRGKLTMGPVWDFNSAMDNFTYSFDGTDFDFQYNVWYFMLLKNERFVGQVIKRYRELRKTYLSETYLQNYVDETVAYLGDAVDRNFTVWGYTFAPENGLLVPEDRNIESYEEAIAQVKSFIHKRGAWLDQHIELLWQFSHQSKVKKYDH